MDQDKRHNAQAPPPRPLSEDQKLWETLKAQVEAKPLPNSTENEPKKTQSSQNT